MRGLIAFALFFAFVRNGYATNMVVEALRTPAPPTIDGTLDDAVWQQGKWHTGFTRLNNPDLQTKVQTYFKIAVNEAAVYFAVRAEEPRTEKLRRNESARDSRVFMDDCIEFMLGADRGGFRYVHIVTNTLGTIYDAEVLEGGSRSHKEWNGNITVACQVEKDAWTVELRLPLAEMCINANTSHEWLFNVVRERWIGTPELSSFAPMVGRFHQPNQFALLRLPAIGLSRYRWTVAPPATFRLTPTEGSLQYSALARIKNETGQSCEIIVRPKWIGSRLGFSNPDVTAGPDVIAVFANTQERLLAFTFPLREEGPGNLLLELRDKQHPETLWAIGKLTTELKRVPLAVEMFQPCYRNNIYATQSLQEIHAVARIEVPPKKRAKSRLHVALIPTRGQPDPLAEATFDVVATDVEITLPLPQLATGVYTLTVTLEQGEERVAQSNTVIKKLPPAANEWRFDENNVLLHNGKPFLPFGWYCPTMEEMTAARCPFNTAQQYNAPYQTVAELRAVLDQYAAAGKVLVINPYPTPAMMTRSAWMQPLTPEEAMVLRHRVRQLKDHPGLIAWYMADEPEGQLASKKRVKQLYDIVADEDPYHPCIMLNNSIAGIHKYHEGGDILMPDPYPQFLRDSFASMPIEKITRFLEACHDATNGRKPTWLVPQAFNYSDLKHCHTNNNRAPSFLELRNMVYQGVIAGAKGFLAYIHWASLHYVDLQRGMSFLAYETADLKGAILAPDAGPILKVNAAIPEHIHTPCRRVDDVLYVFAVNTATEPQKVTFEFINTPFADDTLHVVSEDRALPVSTNASFTDLFECYATHIYTSNPHLAKRESIASAQAEIDKRDSARKKPGNLAFEDNGTRMTASSETDRKSVNKLFDGVLGGRGWLGGKSGRNHDWIEIAWPKELTLGRIVVVSDTISKLAVLAPKGDTWQELAVASRIKDPQVTLRFPPVTVNRLRVEVRKKRRGQQATKITEIEAYTE